MPKLTLTPSLRAEYERLFETCQIRPDKAAEVETILALLLQQRARYETAGRASGVPWYFVAAVHSLETGIRFDRHLHNGDPLSARTTQVPAGRPPGEPPFTWEESAADALALRRLGPDTEWTLAGTLYQLEGYNGWGYRQQHPHVLSPYLWSYSRHYSSGKYVADGTWSDTAVSKQCGAAVLLRRLAEKSLIEFTDQPAPATANDPLVSRYAAQKPAEEEVLGRAQRLQRWLNTFSGIFVKVDGWAGEKTSDAYQRVTGHRLPGDPRG